MKFIYCEGRLSVVYGYHFRFSNELRFQEELPLEQRLSILHFLLNSITKPFQLSGNEHINKIALTSSSKFTPTELN